MSAAAIASLRTALCAFWDEIAPAFSYYYDSCGLERWDGKGEGPSRCVGFEGFGLSLSIFFGRMPRKEGC
jgi:hypothetical protein